MIRTLVRLSLSIWKSANDSDTQRRFPISDTRICTIGGAETYTLKVSRSQLKCSDLTDNSDTPIDMYCKM
jgi:hypothetical protein